MASRRRRCTLLTLAEPHGTETRVFAHVPPIVPYADTRVMSALDTLKLRPQALVVGDGTFGAYADVHRHDGGTVALGTLVAGRFEASRRLYALALARDIVARACGVRCTASAICCEAGGVRCVPLPATFLAEAKRQLA